MKSLLIKCGFFVMACVSAPVFGQTVSTMVQGDTALDNGEAGETGIEN